MKNALITELGIAVRMLIKIYSRWGKFRHSKSDKDKITICELKGLGKYRAVQEELQSRETWEGLCSGTTRAGTRLIDIGSQLSIINWSSRKRFIPSHPELQPVCCKCTANPPSTQIFLMKWLVDYSLKLRMTSLYRSVTFHPFILVTDASKEDLGEVFYQNQGGKMRVIVYGSHMLTPAELSYHLHSSKLEMKWVLCVNFRDYMFYDPYFIVHTDNYPLIYVMITAKLNAAVHRWVGKLTDFQHPYESVQWEKVCAALEGNKVAQQGEGARMAVFSITTDPQTFPVIDYSDLASKQQRSIHVENLRVKGSSHRNDRCQMKGIR